jgi:hypothetical protein
MNDARYYQPPEPKELSQEEKQRLIESTIEIYKSAYDVDVDENGEFFCGLTWIECARQACSDITDNFEEIADEAKEQYERGLKC